MRRWRARCRIALRREPHLDHRLARRREGSRFVLFDARITSSGIFCDGFQSPCRSARGTLRFFSGIFPGAAAASHAPGFDRLPWESQSPHADILDARCYALSRRGMGRLPWLIAPMPRRFGAIKNPAAYLYLTRTLAKDTEIPTGLITHLVPWATETEMVELPGQFAVRGGIIDVSPLKPLVLCALSCSAIAWNRWRIRRAHAASIAPVVAHDASAFDRMVRAAPEKANLNDAAWRPPSFSGPPENRGRARSLSWRKVRCVQSCFSMSANSA